MYVYAKKLNIRYDCYLIINTNSIYIKCGIVFGFKFYVMSFINVYGK